MGRFSNTLALAKASWQVLKLDRELMVFPVMSFVVSLLVAAPLVIPILLTASDDESSMSGIMIIFGVLLMFALAIVAVFFNGALVFGAHERLTGGDPTIGSALSGATSKVHRLVPWALTTATVGLILRAVRQNMGMIGKILGSLLEMGWEVLTYLIVPIVMFEDLGPIDGVKRSTELFKRTWGENLAARVGFGLVGFVLLIPAFIVSLIAVSSGSAAFAVVGISLAVIYAVVVVVALSAMTAIFQTALYLYATTGQVPAAFADTTLPVAFGPR
jgi:hypothetical protein